MSARVLAAALAYASTVGATATAADQTWRFDTYLDAPSHSFLIATDAGEDNAARSGGRLQYNPRFAPDVGISVATRGIELKVSRKLENRSDVETYGTTTYTDWRGKWELLRWVEIEAFSQEYVGFYADLAGQEGTQTSFDKDDGTPEPSGDAKTRDAEARAVTSGIVKREDLSIAYRGAGATFKVPMLDIMLAMPGPKKNTFPPGSRFDFLVKVFGNELAIEADDPLVPAERSEVFASVADVRAVEAKTTGGAAGLGIDIPMSAGARLFVNAVAGAGVQRQTLTETDAAGDPEKRTANADYIAADLGLDLMGESHGMGMKLYMDTVSSKFRDAKFNSNRLGAIISYAYKTN